MHKQKKSSHVSNKINTALFTGVAVMKPTATLPPRREAWVEEPSQIMRNVSKPFQVSSSSSFSFYKPSASHVAPIDPSIVDSLDDLLLKITIPPDFVSPLSSAPSTPKLK